MDLQTRRRGRGGDDNIGVATSVEATNGQTGNLDRGIKRSSKGWFIYVAGVAAAIALLGAVIVILLPCPIEPVYFSLPPPPAWTGPLAPNDKLLQADKLFENQLFGPESIVVDGEFLYTGTKDGRVVSIHKGEIRTLARFGNGTNCGTFSSEPVCGRPLGMRMDRDGYLLVADGYLGIFRVNVATGDTHQLLSSQSPLAGKRPKLLNDIEEGPDGIIYFTDSSTRWDRRHNRYCLLEGEASGRLLSYDPETLRVEKLMDGLAFANGVAVSYDQTHILVVETTMAQIWRYYLSGPKKGEVDIFADNLPGVPDNIRRSGRGTYWVGMAAIRRAEKLSLIDIAGPRPWIRRLVTKVLSQEMIMYFLPKYGLIIELDKEGRIIRSLHDPTGKQVPSVSEGEEKDGALYIGSYFLPFLNRVYLHRK